VSDACTSIVAQTPDGTVLHGRNLDFWAGMGFTDSLKNLTFIVRCLH
jgi:penicillin V acylase-like amidase (Ntn superfamily)